MNQRLSDEELMIAYQLGDAHAFTVLYERHSGRALRYLVSKTRNRALAEDVFQASFLKLHRMRSRYSADYPFLPWLFTICRSELVDALRKRARTPENYTEHLPEFISGSPEGNFDTVEAMKSLPENQKQALELRFEKDFSFEEIAERLETSPGNARKLVSRAIQFLRGAYGKR